MPMLAVTKRMQSYMEHFLLKRNRMGRQLQSAAMFNGDEVSFCVSMESRLKPLVCAIARIDD